MNYRILTFIFFLVLACLIRLNQIDKPTALRQYAQKTEDVEAQNAKDRQEWWTQVTGPAPTIEQSEIAEQAIRKQLKNRSSGTYRDAGINEWEELGPTNIGGRIRAVAIDPNNTQTIYIGAAAGGVWKSTNGGTSWSLSTPEHFGYPVTSIAIHPDSSNIIVATTGEYLGSAGGGNLEPSGIGIIKSIDSGNTWYITTPPPIVQFNWLSKIIYNPIDPNVLYCTGSRASNNFNSPLGRVFKSTNRGESWSLLWSENSGTLSVSVMDIEINPIDTSELIIGTMTQALISNNSGVSWTNFMGTSSPKITTVPNFTGERCEVEYCTTNPSTISILRYLTPTNGSNLRRTELWQSNDGGSSWSNLQSTQADSSVPGDEDSNILSNQGNYDNVLWVDPTNCGRMLLGGINLWKYQNSTLTRISEWQDDIGGNNTFGAGNNSIHADQHVILPDPNYNGTGNRRVFIGNDGGLYKSEFIWQATTNSGWSSLVTGLNITQLYGVDVSLTGDTLVAGSQDNSYFTERSGNNWDNVWQVHGTGDGGHGAIKKSDPEVIYSSTQRGNFIKSTNGGDTYWDMFDLHTGGQNDQPIFIAPLEMDPNDDETLYVGAQRLWKSSNEGDDWNDIKSDIVPNRAISTIEIANGNSNHIWVGYNTGQLANSLDGGATWNPILPASSGAYINDIAINPNNHNEVIIVRAGGYQTNGTSYSNDGGLTWTTLNINIGGTNLSLQTFSVTWHPELYDWIYIGTDRGIFASENKGLNWSVTPLYSESEGPIFTPVVELVWQGSGSHQHPYHLVAASHGRGAWRTKFPIRDKFYVDKNCSPCGTGSFARPYASFKSAVAAAGSGSEIIFLSGGDYNEVPSSILMKKRIKVTLNSSLSTPVVIE